MSIIYLLFGNFKGLHIVSDNTEFLLQLVEFAATATDGITLPSHGTTHTHIKLAAEEKSARQQMGWGRGVEC